ncbi:MAG: hypothetical protein NTV52_29020 [Acidobacteria bacterium]|jgi:hypothetical protein|nr:hypothetical protein [Acidobacteriota bacterium]
MEVHFTPELEKRLSDISAQTGRPTDELVQDVMAGYVHELVSARDTLDCRYDDLKAGRVELVDGETFFDNLRQREEALLESARR